MSWLDVFEIQVALLSSSSIKRQASCQSRKSFTGPNLCPTCGEGKIKENFPPGSNNIIKGSPVQCKNKYAEGMFYHNYVKCSLHLHFEWSELKVTQTLNKNTEYGLSHVLVTFCPLILEKPAQFTLNWHHLMSTHSQK